VTVRCLPNAGGRVRGRGGTLSFPTRAKTGLGSPAEPRRFFCWRAQGEYPARYQWWILHAAPPSLRLKRPQPAGGKEPSRGVRLGSSWMAAPPPGPQRGRRTFPELRVRMTRRGASAEWRLGRGPGTSLSAPVSLAPY
jgi:hypothetical protein